MNLRAHAGSELEDRIIDSLGAPRSMKMGTIASPSRYEEVRSNARARQGVRRNR